MAIGTSPRGGAKPDTKVSGFFDLKLITVDTRRLYGKHKEIRLEPQACEELIRGS
jgi:hypothetical protein